jgi:hypothetical protein
MISSDATMCYACGSEIGGSADSAEPVEKVAKRAVKPVARVKKVVKKKKVL